MGDPNEQGRSPHGHARGRAAHPGRAAQSEDVAKLKEYRQELLQIAATMAQVIAENTHTGVHSTPRRSVKPPSTERRRSASGPAARDRPDGSGVRAPEGRARGVRAAAAGKGDAGSPGGDEAALRQARRD